jgi:multiple sugar transport system permease protein
MAVTTTEKRLNIRRSPYRSILREMGRYKLGYLFLAPALIVLTFVDFVPMAQGFWSSFHQSNLFRPSTNPWVGDQQYHDLVHDPLFWRALWQTGYYTFASVAGQFLIGLAAAALLNQSARLRGFFRGLVVIPWVVPGALAGVMFALLFTSTGLVNEVLTAVGIEGHLMPKNYPWLSNGTTAMPVVIVTSAWKGFPFFTVMFLAAMQTVSKDLYEAAKVDGASAWRSFINITIPGIRTTMLIASLLGLIWTFNSLDLIYVMTYGGPYYSTTTLVMLAYQQAFADGQVGYATAMSMVIVLFMALFASFYLVLYRRAERSS